MDFPNDRCWSARFITDVDKGDRGGYEEGALGAKRKRHGHDVPTLHTAGFLANFLDLPKCLSPVAKVRTKKIIFLFVLVARPHVYHFFVFAYQECNDSQRNRILNSIPSTSSGDNHHLSCGVRNSQQSLVSSKHQDHIASAETALETLNNARSLLKEDLKKVCDEIADLTKKRRGKNVAASLEKLEIRKVDLERELTKLGVEVLDDDDDDNDDIDETDDIKD